MRKSLVLITVIAASLALTGVVFAFDGCGLGVPGCGPTKFEAKKPNVKVVPAKTIVMKPFKPAGPKCVTVPPPPVTISVPGEAFAEADYKVPGWETKKAPVYRELCKGKAKGGFATSSCDMMAPAVTWSANWVTLEELGEINVKVPGLVTKKAIIPVVSVPEALDSGCF